MPVEIGTLLEYSEHQYNFELIVAWRHPLADTHQQ